jgi:hypothetical protein
LPADFRAFPFISGPFFFIFFLARGLLARRVSWAGMEPICCRSLSGLLLLAAAAFLGATEARPAPLAERLRPERLRATHEAVERLAYQWRPVELAWPGGLRDVRALIHVHSSLSYDSRGSLDEIVAGARSVGAQVVMFAEHPAGDRVDPLADGHSGLRDGVLLVPGAEASGLLLFPAGRLEGPATNGQPTKSPRELIERTVATGGLAFLSHLEEPGRIFLPALAGCEIYNTHADAKDELRLSEVLRAPELLAALASGASQFPQETFAAIQDYPADYLRRWDQASGDAKLTGIAANDAHHNLVFEVRAAGENRFELVDPFGKRLFAFSNETLASLRELLPADIGQRLPWRFDLDPYERTFRYVSTHLLARDVTRDEVFAALRSGRAYVAFDWLADPTGFVFLARSGEATFPMGSTVAWRDGLTFEAGAPLPCRFELFRDGRPVERREGRSARFEVSQPGLYRLEAWLVVAGEERLWIVSNAVRITDARAEGG